MPRLPQVSMDAPSGPGPASPVGTMTVGNQAVARGNHRIGQALQELGGYLADVYVESQASREIANATEEIQGLSFRLKEGSVDANGELIPPPDPLTHEKTFQEEVDRILSRSRERLSTGRAQRIFDNSIRQVVGQQTLAVKANALELYKSGIAVNVEESLRKDATNFVNGTEFEKGAIRENAFSRIDRAVSAGVYTPEQGNRAKQQFIHMAETGSALKLLQESPEALRAAIKNGEFSHLPADEVQRFDMRAADAIRAREDEAWTRRERNRRESERLRAERWNKNRMELALKYYDPAQTLTLEEIKQADLDPDDKEALARLLTKKDSGEGNPLVYGPLFDRAYRGEDVSKEALQAVTNGHLTGSQHRTLLGILDTHSAGFKRRNNLKTGYEFLDQQLRVDVGDVRAETKNAIRAEVMKRWGDWNAENPNATPEEAEREYRALAREAQFVRMDDMMNAKLIPRALKGGAKALRFDPDVPESIDAARSELDRAFAETERRAKLSKDDAEHFDETEYRRQIQILNEWDRLLENRIKRSTGQAAK